MNHDFAGAAAQLGIEENWLQKNYRELGYPHRRFGRAVRFSDADIAEINEMSAVRPNVSAPTHWVPAALLELKPGRAPRGRRPAAQGKAN
ncbi:hypothetical protein [Streptomyces sp. CB03911]|uniref:hypothetical protein n=1 Tax=Streptomyces sp. CB03911 TaxID=1804758 RepID=UPI00093BB42D|nr:hypothetical protein [Streptomyces sp. CB03911]OKI14177.1 hypothetical protein A6A07_13565 [Streptomyces sp. CB03911]